ncbi:MAG: hypothetical protein KC733_12535, partial [Candidatus Omnitrophica bacterium]|nr:hypothetical protein [Candidatus Omnitrophota bacterium]
MKKVFNSFLAVMIVLVMASTARAELAVVTASIGADDVYELNTLTPGATKTFLGTRLRGPLQAGVDNSAANEFGLGPEAYTASTAVLLKVTGSNHGESVTLANGYQNQEFTIVLETDGGTTFTVSPSTK